MTDESPNDKAPPPVPCRAKSPDISQPFKCKGVRFLGPSGLTYLCCFGTALARCARVSDLKVAVPSQASVREGAVP